MLGKWSCTACEVQTSASQGCPGAVGRPVMRSIAPSLAAIRPISLARPVSKPSWQYTSAALAGGWGGAQDWAAGHAQEAHAGRSDPIAYDPCEGAR